MVKGIQKKGGRGAEELVEGTQKKREGRKRGGWWRGGERRGRGGSGGVGGGEGCNI